jgi:TolB-like protein/class 3 adenylate cyclase
MRRQPNTTEQLLALPADGEPTRMEIAHVLFTDIVGYSQLPMDEQTDAVQQLNRLVRETGEFRRAEAGGRLISLPTGDGLALVFFGDAESALRCALELSRGLCAAPDLKLRMGVHTGPVYRVDDINTNMNVAGDGINTAQRVMDCGDAGHILVSNVVAGLFGQLRTWAAHLHDLGETEVKHGTRVRLFNLYSDEYGNAALPKKLCRGRSAAVRSAQSTQQPTGKLKAQLGKRTGRSAGGAEAVAAADEKVAAAGPAGKRAARAGEGGNETQTGRPATASKPKSDGGAKGTPEAVDEAQRGSGGDAAAAAAEVAEVNERGSRGTDAATTSLSPTATAGKGRRYRILLVPALLLAALLAGVGYFYFRPDPDKKPIRSIAIIPFTHETGNDDIEYLSDGITEDLINSLTQLPNLTVQPRDPAFRFKGKSLDVTEIGRQMKVQAVLTGHVTHRGDELRLHVALIAVETGANLWSRTYQRRMSNLTTLRSEVALDVTDEIHLSLSSEDERKLGENGTENGKAYQLYLQGRAQWNSRTASGLKRAAEFYKRATDEDPEYARAYAGMAESYVLFPLFGAARPKDSMPLAKAAALRALEIRRKDSQAKAKAHVALGAYLSNYAWNHSAGEIEFRRAIEINPKYETAHQWLGNMSLQAMGKFDESIAAGRVAERLASLSPIISADTAQNLFFARRYDEAIEHFQQRALIIDPNFAYSRYYLGATYHAKGMYEEAIAEYRLSLALNDDPYVKALLARSLAKAGRRGEAVNILDELKSDAKRRYVQSVAFALVYGALGQMTEAFDWLEKDMAERSYYPAYYAVDPTYDELRADPRFADLVRRVAEAKMD